MNSTRDLGHSGGWIPSTTWEWRKVILAEASAPAGDQREHRELRPARRRRDQWKPAEVVVRYRGGPEASVAVTYRGRTWRFPGHRYLIDVLLALDEI